jgi:hypothetical protein
MVIVCSTAAIAHALLVGVADVTLGCTRNESVARSPTSTTPLDPPPSQPVSFTDQPWDTLTGNGWNYLRRASSRDADIVVDSTAPVSPQRVLRIVFTPDMTPDSEPSVHWTHLSSSPREISISWAMKLSRNWTTSGAGGGKIAFLWPPDGEGQVYINIGGSRSPHRINVNTEWAPYDQRLWEPNVTTTPITYDEWYQIEWYMRWESSRGAADGIVRWSVNGVVNGDHRNVVFPACCFQQFEFAPTRQDRPRFEEYMYIDHTRVTRP